MTCNAFSGCDKGLQPIDNSSKPCLAEGCNTATCCERNQIIIIKKYLISKRELTVKYLSKNQPTFFI